MELLNEVMRSDKTEIQEQIENVKSLFSKISCFLLPYPGREVDTSETFKGDLNGKHCKAFSYNPENDILFCRYRSRFQSTSAKFC